jgi:hypothetical protein
MVDMGDDAEVADIFHHTGNFGRSLYPKGRQFRYCPFWGARTASYTQAAFKDILDNHNSFVPYFQQLFSCAAIKLHRGRMV